MTPPRIYLSPPYLNGQELPLVHEAFTSNWIAPLGPHVDAFEQEFCVAAGTAYAAALSSGTAALHLALRALRLSPGDEVICSTLTFSATVNPITYEGAVPIFVDSDDQTWNMSPALLQEAIRARRQMGKRVRAVIVVHLYGQSADVAPILAICRQHDVPLIEDAAEALGATYKGKAPGSLGWCGIHSFNGNKIITTSGGGMLVSNDKDLIDKARHLATQARDPAPHYQHSEIGFNYRMSNVLAAIGRGQLKTLSERVSARRRNFSFYQEALRDLPGISFMPEASYGTCTRWLTCILINPVTSGVTREQVRLALERENIEARPVWKPMHRQPVFQGFPSFGGVVSERLFECGLCLPSGSDLTASELERVTSVIRREFRS